MHIILCINVRKFHYLEQNLIDGTSKMGNNGDGGTMNNCFEYVRENGGIELNETYPYSGPVTN